MFKQFSKWLPHLVHINQSSGLVWNDIDIIPYTANLNYALDTP